MLKKLLLILLSLVLFVGMVLAGYVIYLQVNYYRIPDHTPLKVNANPETKMALNTPYKVTSYNIGFGAYGPEFSFFMDKEILKENHEMVYGHYGKGIDRENVERNLKRSRELLEKANSDFYTLQEVDTDSTRSYHLDERDIFIQAFPGYGYDFAENFHSPFLAYPFYDMHGAVKAGLLTFSKFHIREAERRSFPIDESFINKFKELDRCFAVNRYALANGKEFVLVNQHMSAYDESGVVRKAQLECLNAFLKAEKEKGNYVIIAGDFNHDYCNSRFDFTGTKVTPPWIMPVSDDELVAGYHFVIPDNHKETGSCRSAASPYRKGESFASIIDGYIVSENIQATSHIIPAEYTGSDHNPISLEFTLLG